MYEDLQPWGVSRQLEESEYLDDGDELEDVSLVADPLGHAGLDYHVHVEAQSGYEVDHVDWRLDELDQVWGYL